MYLAMDAEFSAIELDGSLLELYLGVYDVNFDLVKEINLLLKPDNGRYFVDPESMKVNGIDLVKHTEEAIPYKEGKTLVYNFLNEHRAKFGSRLTPVGHNMGLDLRYIWEKLVSKQTWDNFVSYRLQDTGVIGEALRNAGVINVAGCSLGQLRDYFGVYVKGRPHSAQYDATVTLKVYKKMLDLLGKLKGVDR